MPPPGTPLCLLDELQENIGHEFTFGSGPNEIAIFVIRKNGDVFAYINDCPHTHSPLNWTPGRFLDPSQSLIQCSTHGARFRIEDGFCISGPCKGDSLTQVPIKVSRGVVAFSISKSIWDDTKTR